MSFTDFQIDNFRNISSAKVSFSSNRNIITGKNASGKTSLLEALYFLCLSKSFRTKRIDEIIQEDCQHLQLIATHKKDKQSNVFGLKRGKKKTAVRYAGNEIGRISDQAKIQPLILITPDSNLLVSGPPKRRRALIDWVMFHVEHDYYFYWQKFNKILKQRNALLRQKGEARLLDIWDEKLVESANELEQHRSKSIMQMLDKLRDILAGIQSLSIDLVYSKGWRDDELLSELKKYRKRDLACGYTSKGPHRADLLIQTNAKPAVAILSRGQMKLLAVAIELGKAMLLLEKKQKRSLIMFDDLSAEFDEQSKQTVYEMLELSGLQQIITSVDISQLPRTYQNDAKMFHVKHGDISEVIY